ncbi:MAG: hypothetical protein H0S80_08695 [Desulfovibrionaceae bacterium]|nr:hypothetical protein [Desulfovibrionaceae bacterium]
MEMDLDLVFVDGVLLIALMAFLASLGHSIGRFIRAKFPTLSRMPARFERRYPQLFDEDDSFYCFFSKGALYGN